MHLLVNLALLVVVHSANTTAAELRLRQSVIYFEIQSKNLSFDQWFTMFTLALASLATHIVFGLADPVLLGTPEPKWSHLLPHCNPASITWRYFAIAY